MEVAFNAYNYIEEGVVLFRKDFVVFANLVIQDLFGWQDISSKSIKDVPVGPNKWFCTEQQRTFEMEVKDCVATKKILERYFTLDTNESTVKVIFISTEAN